MDHESRSKPEVSPDPSGTDPLSSLNLPSLSPLTLSDATSTIDLASETFSNCLCKIKDSFLEQFSLGDLKEEQAMLQNTISGAVHGLTVLSSGASLLGSLVSLANLEQSDTVSHDTRELAHKDIEESIEQFESLLAEHKNSNTEMTEQERKQEKELQAVVERLKKLIDVYKKGADDTNHQIQRCEPLQSDGPTLEQSQQNTDELKIRLEEICDGATCSVEKYRQLLESTDLSPEELAIKLAEIAEQIEQSTEDAERESQEFESQTQELIESTDISEKEKSDLSSAITSIWKGAQAAATEIWNSVNETLNTLAKDVLGSWYGNYQRKRVELQQQHREQQQQQQQHDEYVAELVQAESELRTLEKQSLYVVESIDNESQEATASNATVEQVYEEHVPVAVKLRRFVAYIALVLPMPFGENDRDYRQRRELREEQDKAREVDELLGKKIVKGLDDTLPQYERLTRNDGWKKNF